MNTPSTTSTRITDSYRAEYAQAIHHNEVEKLLREVLDSHERLEARVSEIESPEEDRAAVMQAAYKIDPECWISYSGKEKKFKQAMDIRRTAAMETARRNLGQR